MLWRCSKADYAFYHSALLPPTHIMTILALWPRLAYLCSDRIHIWIHLQSRALPHCCNIYESDESHFVYLLACIDSCFSSITRFLTVDLSIFDFS
jgi:hypothetical protein